MRVQASAAMLGAEDDGDEQGEGGIDVFGLNTTFHY
jgi:hypothetical protein